MGRVSKKQANLDIFDNITFDFEGRALAVKEVNMRREGL
jgi:hypothetical protein